MKQFKGRKDREQQDLIVRPGIIIQDPSAELFSDKRPWESDDALQDSFLQPSSEPQLCKACSRIPKLKYGSTIDTSTVKELSPSREERKSRIGDEGDRGKRSKQADTSERLPPIPLNQAGMNYDVSPEAVVDPWLSRSTAQVAPKLPTRHPKHIHSVPDRSSSLPPTRHSLRLSLAQPKTDFQTFSQRCAPSPVSPSSAAVTPVYELPAFEMIHTVASEMPAELEGSPVDTAILHPAPLDVPTKPAPESEPEASPYNRFTSYSKSIHALNANLAPIVETEEEAASRRTSAAYTHELPSLTPLNSIPLSAYMGGTSITPRNHRRASSAAPDMVSTPARNASTRSSNSTISSASRHSVFSFEFSNSDTEKIYVSSPMDRRESSAPSLTDLSSVDDFDVDVEFDTELRRGRSITRSDVKLERFFGIRQYSVDLESCVSPATDLPQPSSATSETFPGVRHDSEMPTHPAHRLSRSSISIDDLDLSLALENDPYKRELMRMHKSILFTSQNKQDKKLEKFFGCDKDQIQVARKSSTGIRLLGSSDDLKYRSIGW